MKVAVFDHPDFAAAPRLIYVHLADHHYTFRQMAGLLRDRGIAAARVSVEALLQATALPAATYILTDFDRMHATEIEVLGRVRDRLRQAGMRVENDPRGFRPRAAVLRQLYQAGINRFTCWLPAFGEMPDRYPVFLRSIAGHRGVIGDLLTSPAGVRAAIAQARSDGFALSDLVVIEYAAEPFGDNGMFQKHAAFMINGRVIRANTVTEGHWVAKHGTSNAATPEFYRSERDEQDDYPHADLLRRAFEMAEVAFGRADFGIVQGQPQIYEINTNPTTAMSVDHANADRRVSLARLRAELLDGFAALACPASDEMVDIADVCDRSGIIKGMPRRL